MLDHRIDCFIPRDACHFAVSAKQGMGGAGLGFDGVMFREALGAELAGVHGMVGVAAHADYPAISHAELHSATHGTVSAGGVHPSIGMFARRGVAENRVLPVGVLSGLDVEADSARKPGHEAHAAS